VISFARCGSGFLDDPQELDLMAGPNLAREIGLRCAFLAHKSFEVYRDE